MNRNPLLTSSKQPKKKRRRHYRPVRHRVEYASARTLAFILKILPRPLVELMGRAVGLLVFYSAASRRSVALKNLDLAFGETRTEADKKRIARQSMSNFGYWFLEMLAYEGMSREKLAKRMIYSESCREIWEEVASEGKGLIFLLTHFSNWELLGLYLGDQAFGTTQTAVVAKTMHNSLISDWIHSIRAQTGNEVIYVRDAGMKVLRMLRANKAVAILFDQATTLRRGGIESSFFGHPCVTYRAVAAFSLATGAPIINVFCLPRPGGRFEIFFERMESFEPGEDKEDSIHQLTQLCNDKVETYIRKYPECYFWVHKRWKHRPPGSPPVYD